MYDYRGVVALGALLLVLPLFSFASVSNGTIDSSFKLNKICQDTACTTYGVVNWKPTLGAGTPGASPVAVTDSGLTGHVWGDQIGWVNLAPTGEGVDIDPDTGELSGTAYSQTGGWINFAPTQASGNPGVGVSINDDGEFEGYAYVSGLYGGWMKFDCNDGAACVKTDWRPTSARGGGGSSGGYRPTGSSTEPYVPPAGPVTPTTPSLPQTPLGEGEDDDFVVQEVSDDTVPTPEMPFPVDMSHLKAGGIEAFTELGDVRIYSTVRTLNAFANNAVTPVQREYFIFTPGTPFHLVVHSPANDPVVNVQTQLRYIGPLTGTGETIEMGAGFFSRLMQFFGVGIAEAAEVVEYTSDAIMTPEKSGVYDLFVTVTYKSGKTETKPGYGLLITDSRVVYTPGLFLPFTAGVEGAKLTATLQNGTTSKMIESEDNGEYALVLKEGRYLLDVEASGYVTRNDIDLLVPSGEHSVRQHIELVCKPWSHFTCQWDLKLLLLLLILGGGYWYMNRGTASGKKNYTFPKPDPLPAASAESSETTETKHF